MLQALEELYEKIETMDAMRRRLENLNAAVESFERNCRTLARELGLPGDANAIDLAEQLWRESRRASEASVKLERKKEAQAEAAQARMDEAAARETLERLCAEAGRESAADLAAAELESDRLRERKNRLLAVESQLLEAGGGLSIAELEREAEIELEIQSPAIGENAPYSPGGEPASGMASKTERLESHLADLKLRIQKRRSDLEELNKNIGDVRAQLRAMDDGSDEAAQCAQRAREILARARDLAERYAVARAACVILDRQIEAYRRKNEGPLARRASRIFSRLTLGSFQGLSVDYSESDTPTLVGERPNGKKIAVDGMSEGARDQLYLALRLAALDDHLERGARMPLIVDDALIGFDDERALAALEMFREVSDKTQVIFFTHHARLVELARKIERSDCVFVQELPARNA
ncbi:MAG: hypothetical protein BWZ10_02271 [candidate division BRC1 bacterium ADurb.BinA364]|nr:MAG: hypothetical protein BWZ10_02271 [candidate division BRC1 bacterium ADurb.BinA364]